MVSALVSNNEPSNEEGQSRSVSSGPGTSERVFLVTQMLRASTPALVLGTTQHIYLPEDHPLLRLMDWLFMTFGVQGVVSTSSAGPSLYHLVLELAVLANMCLVIQVWEFLF